VLVAFLTQSGFVCGCSSEFGLQLPQTTRP
jgi:hypothetical protein